MAFQWASWRRQGFDSPSDGCADQRGGSSYSLAEVQRASNRRYMPHEGLSTLQSQWVSPAHLQSTNQMISESCARIDLGRRAWAPAPQSERNYGSFGYSPAWILEVESFRYAPNLTSSLARIDSSAPGTLAVSAGILTPDPIRCWWASDLVASPSLGRRWLPWADC
jgi:hypothetical protein